ncbi:MAG: hemolysin family protein [Planctomycetota bacterium]
MNDGLWIYIAAGAGFAGSLLSSIQHALRETSRHGLEATAVRREVSRRQRLARTEASSESVQGAGAGADVASEAGSLDAPASVAAVAADLDGHTGAVAVPRVVCNLVVGVGLVLWITHLRGLPAPELLDIGLGMLAAALVTWLLSVVVPIAVARHAAERTVLGWLWLVRLCYVAMGPLRLVQSFVAEVVRRLAGEDARDEIEAREAELLSLVEESEREGQIDEHARDMIEAVVEFGSTTVEQIMTPRTEIRALEYTDDLAAIKDFARDSGHSRIPVFREDIDHIEGVLYVKDFLRWILDGGELSDGPFTLTSILREPTFVPETKPVREFLQERLADKVHVAIALDEYGGTSGLVTLEDIVEEVFGEIRDEYEPEDADEPMVIVDALTGVAMIEGRAEIDDANDELEAIGLVLPEHDDYDTVGGFVVTTMGKIPEAGEVLVHGGVAVRIIEAEPTRVLRVSVRRAEEDDAPAEGDAA